jgi:hypothetical protein
VLDVLAGLWQIDLVKPKVRPKKKRKVKVAKNNQRVKVPGGKAKSMIPLPAAWEGGRHLRKEKT